MNKKQCLEILGLSPDSNPTENEIKKAYYKKARETHPDKITYPKDATAEEKEKQLKEGEEKFKKVGEAYDRLIHPEKYKSERGDVDDIFKDFFRDFFNAHSRKTSNTYSGPSSSSSRTSSNFSSNYSTNFNPFPHNFSHATRESQSLYGIKLQLGPYDFISSAYQYFSNQVGLKKILEDLALNVDVTEKNIIICFTQSLPKDFVSDFSTQNSESLVSSLAKSKKLIELKYPEWLFNETQKARIQAVLERNKRRECQKNLESMASLNISDNFSYNHYFKFFRTQKELKKHLENFPIALDSFGENISSLRIRIDSPISTAFKEGFPHENAEPLLQALKKQNKLTEVEYPEWLFNEAQEASLQAVLELNKKVKRQNNLVSMATLSISINSSYDQYFKLFRTQKKLKKHLENFPIALDSFGENISSLNMSIDSPIPKDFREAFPHENAEPFLQALKKQSKLTEVKYPDWLFNDEQRKELREHLDKNRKQQKLVSSVLLRTTINGGITSSYSFQSQKTLEGIIKNISSVISFSTSTLTIAPLSALPEEFTNHFDHQKAQCLLQALKRYDDIVEVTYPQWMFNDEQKSELNKHLKRNNKQFANRRRAEERDYWRYLGAASGIVVGAVTGALYLSTLFTLLNVVVLGLASFYFAGTFFDKRQVDLKAAARKYKMPGKIDNINDPMEHAALESGVKAKTWPGYFSSYGKKPGYRYRDAFKAGMTFAVENNGEMLEKIKSFKIPR